MRPRYPDVDPVPCLCGACRQLAIALDLDIAARRAVREAAELVDARHRLGRPDPDDDEVRHGVTYFGPQKEKR